MLFWILAAIGLAIATFISCLPLFRPKSGWTPIALALVFVLPTGALMLYRDVGTPQALGIAVTPATSADPHSGNTAGADEISDMVGSLQARLKDNPEDLDGWILLARTLKTMQRYPEALEALETARRISPDNSYLIVELVETRIFLSGQGRIDDEMVAMLQEALNQDPAQQKALWLMGIAASQAGEDEAAISYWETLLQQLEPGRTITKSVQDQIAQAQTRLGLETDATTGTESPPTAHPATEPDAQTATKPAPEISASPEDEQVADDATWQGINIRVQPGDALRAEIPPGAVLYVMIRAPGPAAGPPIGVRRVRSPALPLDMLISDTDSMLEERQISSLSEVQLQARLSLGGGPRAQSGDWQSGTMVIPLNSTEPVELLIDQQVE